MYATRSEEGLPYAEKAVLKRCFRRVSYQRPDPFTIHYFFYIRYFTRTILQFQFAEALCDISGHDGPLHRCDFSGSKKAGEALSKMLKLGKSRSWQDALEILTGTYALLSINQSKTFYN